MTTFEAFRKIVVEQNLALLECKIKSMQGLLKIHESNQNLAIELAVCLTQKDLYSALQKEG